MSGENVEVVRAAYERWGRGDFAGDISFFSPDVVYAIGSGFPETGVYSGLAEVGEFMRAWLGAWERASLTALEIIGSGERVFVAAQLTVVGQASGIGGDMPFFHVWTFEDGKAVRLEAINRRDEALQAAGLKEQEPER